MISIENTYMTNCVVNKTIRGSIPLFALLSLLLALLFVSGCGYGFRGSESALPPDIKRVYIPVVINQSTEAGLDLVLTEALRDEFERYGTLTVVDRAAQADAVLKANILSVKQQRSTTTSTTDTALQQYTVMQLSAELRKVGGALLWRDKNLRVQKVFAADQTAIVTTSADFASTGLGSGDLSSLNAREISRGAEKEAFEELSEQVAQRVYSTAVLPEF